MRLSGLKLPRQYLSRNKKYIANAAKIVCFGLVLSAANFSDIAFQDIESMTKGDQRWLMHVPQPAGRTIIRAGLASVSADTDAIVTGSIANDSDEPATRSLRNYSNSSKVITRNSARTSINNESEYIIRDTKVDRIISNVFTRPPAQFSAGSVVERHSWLAPLGADKKLKAAFVQPKSSTEVLKIAAAFHLKGAESKKILDRLPVLVANLVVESQDSILAYSQESEKLTSPFAAVLKGEQNVANIPKLNQGDHLWADDPLPKNSFSSKQQQCLASGVYFEARGEPVRGQAAVAQVILNRVRNPTYPNTICGVVYQNKNWRNRCQFSFACDRIRDRVNNKKLWQTAEHVARETTAGRIWLSQVGSSTHYHATYVKPKWARSMKKVGKIGLHLFYRTFGGGWS